MARRSHGHHPRSNEDPASPVWVTTIGRGGSAVCGSGNGTVSAIVAGGGEASEEREGSLSVGAPTLGDAVGAALGAARDDVVGLADGTGRATGGRALVSGVAGAGRASAGDEGVPCLVPGSAKSRSCSGPTVPSRGGGAGVTILAGAALFCASAELEAPSSRPARMMVDRVTGSGASRSMLKEGLPAFGPATVARQAPAWLAGVDQHQFGVGITFDQQ
jgi:hypothetical protein